MPLEILLTNYKRFFVKDSSVDAICYGAKFMNQIKFWKLINHILTNYGSFTVISWCLRRFFFFLMVVSNLVIMFGSPMLEIEIRIVLIL